MRSPAASMAAHEESTPAINPEGGSHLPRIPRKVRDEIVRACVDRGYAVSHEHAWRLYKDWRAKEARAATVAEFRLYLQRRGDLMQIRSKRAHSWRTHT